MRRALGVALLGAAAAWADAPTPGAAFCASQGNLPTVYFSAVFAEGALPAAREEFQRFLGAQFHYQGQVFCDVRASRAEAQRVMQAELAAKRAHQRAVETGWRPGA